ncbi:MAG: 2-amino-4-hydroxy-6-hydroxymethyldihydropteridine diphosphokinase [Gammaproteobacteria bacterium]
MRAYIGLGSNLDDPPAQLQQAVSALARLPDSRVVAVSPLYRNAPLVPAGEDPAGQPDYVNAVAALDTTLAPLALLDALQAIENDQHRVRGRRWGPRTLDLDLLLYGNERIDLPRLTVPHPGLRERRFVLLPLRDVAPELVLPGGQRLADALAACPPAELVATGSLQLS